jgi:hypothetical protein
LSLVMVVILYLHIDVGEVNLGISIISRVISLTYAGLSLAYLVFGVAYAVFMVGGIQGADGSDARRSSVVSGRSLGRMLSRGKRGSGGSIGGQNGGMSGIARFGRRMSSSATRGRIETHTEPSPVSIRVHPADQSAEFNFDGHVLRSLWLYTMPQAPAVSRWTARIHRILRG